MRQRRPGQGLKLLGAALLFSGCSEKPCMVQSPNDAGMRCGCIDTYSSNGQFVKMPYCDPDLGNPCDLGCYNPRQADGGREYADADTPVCLC
jgi:hypothetical protein